MGYSFGNMYLDRTTNYVLEYSSRYCWMMTKTKIKYAGKLTDETLLRLQKHVKKRRKNDCLLQN